MKRIIAVIVCLVSIALFALPSSAIAAGGADGEQIFSSNCAQCHRGGKNIINAAKTLQKSDLEKYGMYDAEKIIYQVTNGKAAMPAFKRRLKPEQIESVAAYVLEQADAGW